MDSDFELIKKQKKVKKHGWMTLLAGLLYFNIAFK